MSDFKWHKNEIDRRIRTRGTERLTQPAEDTAQKTRPDDPPIQPTVHRIRWTPELGTLGLAPLKATETEGKRKIAKSKSARPAPTPLTQAEIEAARQRLAIIRPEINELKRKLVTIIGEVKHLEKLLRENVTAPVAQHPGRLVTASAIERELRRQRSAPKPSPRKKSR